jgi:hypothetical protein
MSKDATTSLTILGRPGESVRVIYRDRGDEPPPPVWVGQLGADGRVTLDVPQAYLLVQGDKGQAILRLFETRPASETVDLATVSP